MQGRGFIRRQLDIKLCTLYTGKAQITPCPPCLIHGRDGCMLSAHCAVLWHCPFAGCLLVLLLALRVHPEASLFVAMSTDQAKATLDRNISTRMVSKSWHQSWRISATEY